MVITKDIGDYTYINPSKIDNIISNTKDDIISSTPINTEFLIYKIGVYKFNLKPGIYALDADSSVYSNYNIYFTDSKNQDATNITFPSGDSSEDEEYFMNSKTLVVKEKGDYYLHINYDGDFNQLKKLRPEKVTLKKLD